MTSFFTPATRKRVFYKCAITGLAGSTKTWSALAMATGLADGGKIAVIDTENGSSALYAEKFRFDILNLEPPYLDTKFIQAINNAVSEGYKVLIIDSFSHAWLWILDFKAALDAKGGNSYFHWNQAGTKYNAVIAAVLQAPIHVIACLRSKMDYVIEPDAKGKQVPRKIGLTPICREGVEFEFATIFDGDSDHYVTVSKDRTSLFVDQRFQVTEDTGRKLLDWLNSAPEAAEALVGAPEHEPEHVPAPARAPGSPPSPTSTDGSAKPAHEPLSAQQRLKEGLYGIHEDWYTDFLILRGQIGAGQSVMDVSATYCEKALSQLSKFRAAVVKFVEERDAIVVEN